MVTSVTKEIKAIFYKDLFSKTSILLSPNVVEQEAERKRETETERQRQEEANKNSEMKRKRKERYTDRQTDR